MRLCGILLGVCVAGCAESRLDAWQPDPAVPLVQQEPALAPPGDTFWLAQAREEATRPEPIRARSISLGYIGDSPLTGGVMRDTPMAAPNYVQNAPIQQGPCRCAMRDPRYEFEEPE